MVTMDYRAAIVISSWLAVAIIASVYMLVFGSRVGDVFFGVFLPVGLMVVAALAVTFQVLSSPQSKQD